MTHSKPIDPQPRSSAERSENHPPLAQIPRGEYAYPGPLRDSLVEAIIEGTKTSTSCLLAEFEPERNPLTDLEALEAVVDSHDNIVCVTCIIDVRITRLGDITDQHAIAEGEGYTDAQHWRREHERFWRSPEYVSDMGLVDLTDDTPVVCYSFKIDRRYPVRKPVPWDKS